MVNYLTMILTKTVCHFELNNTPAELYIALNHTYEIPFCLCLHCFNGLYPAADQRF